MTSDEELKEKEEFVRGCIDSVGSEFGHDMKKEHNALDCIMAEIRWHRFRSKDWEQRLHNISNGWAKKFYPIQMKNKREKERV
jgi:hypothetical protein